MPPKRPKIKPGLSTQLLHFYYSSTYVLTFTSVGLVQVFFLDNFSICTYIFFRVPLCWQALWTGWRLAPWSRATLRCHALRSLRMCRGKLQYVLLHNTYTMRCRILFGGPCYFLEYVLTPHVFKCGNVWCLTFIVDSVCAVCTNETKLALTLHKRQVIFHLYTKCIFDKIRGSQKYSSSFIQSQFSVAKKSWNVKSTLFTLQRNKDMPFFKEDTPEFTPSHANCLLIL